MLTFNLKKEWFEKIKSGEKTHEYREWSFYWAKRISNAIVHFLYHVVLNLAIRPVMIKIEYCMQISFV